MVKQIIMRHYYRSLVKCDGGCCVRGLGLVDRLHDHHCCAHDHHRDWISSGRRSQHLVVASSWWRVLRRDFMDCYPAFKIQENGRRKEK